ncbi:MAG: cereblon family protein [Pseudomonadota bacterium]
MEDKADAPESDELILCRQCHQIITRPADRISVNGAHRHVFANPHGMVYEIGCFRTVTGCGSVGETSTEFAWFAGYAWRVLACTGCLSHLGWVFIAGGGDRFYGLILDHLISSS